MILGVGTDLCNIDRIEANLSNGVLTIPQGPVGPASAVPGPKGDPGEPGPDHRHPCGEKPALRRHAHPRHQQVPGVARHLVGP